MFIIETKYTTVISDTGVAKWENVKLLPKANENCLYSVVKKIQEPHVNPKGKDKMHEREVCCPGIKQDLLLCN